MGSSAFIAKRVKTPAIKNPKDAGPDLLDSQYSGQPLVTRPDPVNAAPASVATAPASVSAASVPSASGAMSASSTTVQPKRTTGYLEIPEHNLAPNISPNPGEYIPDPNWKVGDPKPPRPTIQDPLPVQPPAQPPVQPAVNQPLGATVNATGSTEVAGLPAKKKFGLLRSRFLSGSGLFRTLTNGPQGISGGADGLLTPSASAGSKPTLG